jgi:DNA-directed RNA polymerase III subunit RPC4
MARRNQQASGFGGGPSGSRAHIKREIKGEEEEDAEMNRALGFTTKIKSEKNLQDGGYVSSDDDDDQYGPRLDIDAIDLSSGDDANDLEDKPKGSSIPRMLLPIRITRREHQDRVIGINTESSTVGLTKGSNSVEKKEGGSATEATDAASRKGKAKAKNVEITEDCKPYKGMWQDADESGGEVKINDEPVDDDAPITASEVAEAKLAMKEESPQLDMKSHLKGKGRLRRRSGALGSKPVLQTEEDKQEWERSQAELEDILVELGQTPQPATTTGVKDDDVDMKDGEQPRDVKSDRVYLFQFPPVLPALVPPSIKKEAQEETLIIATTDQTPIKVEDDDAKVPPPAAMTAGRVGKMRVHASGKVTLNWGGTSFEIKKGMSTHFLQDTVVTRIRPENERVMPGDEGDALAFGQVRGKFVVTPDWSAML